MPEWVEEIYDDLAGYDDEQLAVAEDGRIDRYGQRTAPDIRHFVGTGWDRAVDSYEADLEFLARVAKKVAQMESDLGKVNSVLSDAVTRRMLGAVRGSDAYRLVGPRGRGDGREVPATHKVRTAAVMQWPQPSPPSRPAAPSGHLHSAFCTRGSDVALPC